MPTYIIVATDVRIARGMYISQASLEVIIDSLRAHPGQQFFAVYELTVNAEASQLAPSNCVSLRSAAFIHPPDEPSYLRGMWGTHIDQLPDDQFEFELTKMEDYLTEKRRHHNVRKVEQTATG